MAPGPAPRVVSIPAGVRFLDTLVDALLDGRLVDGFAPHDDPLALANATIYLPTRRAARALRAAFVERLGGRAAILPVIRPLGEFDEEGAILLGESPGTLDLEPAIGSLDRILLLAPLVQAWKGRLPAHVAGLYGEDIVVPTSLADAVWLARDLGELIDEIETEGADWARLTDLVPAEMANWWQVTLEFLRIVTGAWPLLLAERGRSNPAAHRNAGIDAETARLLRRPPSGPVIAAGSTGSIPATARLLAAIARLPGGAVVLPGLDLDLDARSWDAIGDRAREPSAYGHPQTMLRKLLGVLGVDRAEVQDLAQAPPAFAARMRIVNAAMRPAETTDDWPAERQMLASPDALAGLEGLTLVEAANEREEALAIAVALRMAIAEEGRRAALVTADRDLARRVAAELKRFGIEADDSGGTPLRDTAPATLLRLMLRTVFRPGDPVSLLALLKHPLLRLGLRRSLVRSASETIELVALRGGTGRPDIADLGRLHAARQAAFTSGELRRTFWLSRVTERQTAARAVLDALDAAIGPLVAHRASHAVPLHDLALATVAGLEALGRDAEGGLVDLYRGDAGEALANLLRDLLASGQDLPVAPAEWPDMFDALVAGATVKPRVAGDPRVAIWGTLEARLQAVDTLVLGGLNEGSWPRRPRAGRFMSRSMLAGLAVEPPERRIGQAAHDFVMGLGAPSVVLTRAARSGDAPAVASRWLQRLRTFAGAEALAAAEGRGAELVHWARLLDVAPDQPFAPRPAPKPPLAARPTRLSVTEIETLRRDPYAIHARHVLKLEPLEPVVGDPGAAERGTLFHDIVHAFLVAAIDPRAADARDRLIGLGRAAFDRAALPADVDALWWPRFRLMAGELLSWEAARQGAVAQRLGELAAVDTPIGTTGVSLRGRADRLDLRHDGLVDVLDFKTGLSPSRTQAHRLVAPQLPLEGALLMRGAFRDLGPREPGDLAYVRLRPNGSVVNDPILAIKGSVRTAVELSEEAWGRLERLIAHYMREDTGYLSRALPFRELDVDGPYDHLARVREWSAGGGEEEGEP